MLVIQPLTPRPQVTDNASLREWAETTDDDGRRDRGQLILLTGAIKQQEYSQAQIDEQAAKAAKALQDAADKINKISTEVKRPPFWKRIFK